MKESEEQFVGATQSKNSFVTILSWIFIAIMGLSIFGSSIDIAMSFIKPISKLSGVIYQFKFVINFIFAVAFLISASGMLKRKEWARISFIYTAWALIIFSIGNAIYKILTPIKVPGNIQIEPTFFLNFTYKVFPIFTVIFVSIIFGWIINKLKSDEVKQDFPTIANKNTPL